MIELLHGDCLELFPSIPDGSIDLVLADPPYGTTACKWDAVIPLEPMWRQLKRIIKPDTAIVMTASQPFTTTLIASNIKMFKYSWIWQKQKPTNFFNVKWQPLKDHEDVVVFSEKKSKYYPQGTGPVSIKNGRKKKGGNLYQGSKLDYVQTVGNYPRSVQFFAIEGGGRQHPTQKPIALMEYLIKTYSQPGDTVLDFTMGSGTTGVATKKLGRSFIGIELDETYFKIARKRIEDYKRLRKSLKK